MAVVACQQCVYVNASVPGLLYATVHALPGCRKTRKAEAVGVVRKRAMPRRRACWRAKTRVARPASGTVTSRAVAPAEAIAASSSDSAGRQIMYGFPGGLLSSTPASSKTAWADLSLRPPLRCPPTVKLAKALSSAAGVCGPKALSCATRCLAPDPFRFGLRRAWRRVLCDPTLRS